MKVIIDWANENEGFIALLTFCLISVLIPVFRAIANRIDRKLSQAVSEEEIRRIEQIRAEFYANLEFIDRRSAYGPFLIRDIARDRLYFDGDEAEFEKNGAPPSFKVKLVGISVHGVQVFCGHPTRIKQVGESSEWCQTNDENDVDSIVASPIGVIPFSAIVAVNWHGDPAHTYPHIFCRFEFDGWPYKTAEYCERKELREGWDLFVPLVEIDKVSKECR